MRWPLLGALLALGCVDASGGDIRPLPSLGGAGCGEGPRCGAGQLCTPDGRCVASPDAARPDAAPDAAPDLAVDAAPDLAVDAAPDLAVDAAPDLAVDLGPDACVPRDETCDGTDEDCDGEADEDFDLLRDPAHCGACGRACEAGPRAQVECAQGVCALTECEEGWRDLDADPATGCEDLIIELELLAPAAGVEVSDEVEVELSVQGAQGLSTIRVQVGQTLLGELDPAEPRGTIALAAAAEGLVELSFDAYDLEQALIDSVSVEIQVDRSPPELSFLRPEEGAVLDGGSFEAALEADDASPTVRVALSVERVAVAEVGAPPYLFNVDPQLYGPGIHHLRATATDGAGNSVEVERRVRFSYCALDEMVQIPGMEVDIDVYEGSRPDAQAAIAGLDERRPCSQPGVIPWAALSDLAAEAACASAGKRLCTTMEWSRACGGVQRLDYPYGRTYEPRACNGVDHVDVRGLAPTGSLSDCDTPQGVHDMSGNLAEWVSAPDRPATAGGHDAHGAVNLRCSARQEFNEGVVLPQNGLRCCKDR